MLVTAASFSDWIVAVHVLAVIVAFGGVFSYPLIDAALNRSDRRAVPAWHRLQRVLGQRVITPGLAVVLIAGIYLASDLHDWGRFFVGWGIAASLVLGGVGGAYMGPRELKLAELADRDIAAAGPDGEVSWSEEYEKLNGQVAKVGAALALLVVATVFIMVVGAAG